MPTRNTYGVLLALIGVTLLFGGLTTGYQHSGYQHTVTDDPVTIDYGNNSTLDAPEYAFNYSSSVTVTVDNSTLTEGDDYQYHSANGTIAWLNSSNTNDGDTALVDYDYTAPSEDTRDRRNVLYPVARILPYAALGLGVAATLKLATGGW